jgi:hypothetical protein
MHATIGVYQDTALMLPLLVEEVSQRFITVNYRRHCIA